MAHYESYEEMLKSETGPSVLGVKVTKKKEKEDQAFDENQETNSVAATQHENTAETGSENDQLEVENANDNPEKEKKSRAKKGTKKEDQKAGD